MIGGPDDAVARLDPIFATIAPGVDAAERTPGRERRADAGRAGLPALRADRRGALREDGPQRDRVRGHGRLRRGPERDRATPTSARREHEIDAETAPLRDPQYYPYDIDIADVAEVWRRGSVIASWLLDLTAARAAGVARRSRASAGASPTPARAAGRCTPRSTRASRRRCSAPPLYERFSLARRGRVRQQAALGDAQAVRRPRREAAPTEGARLSATATTDPARRAAGGGGAGQAARRPRHRPLRRLRRPRRAQAAAGLLPPRGRRACCRRATGSSAPRPTD